MLISILLQQSLDGQTAGCTGEGDLLVSVPHATTMRNIVSTKIIEKLATHMNPFCANKNPTCTHKNPARFGPSEVRATRGAT